LDGKSGEQDDNEHPVVEKVGENVVFALSKLAGVDLVEQLHEDEGLENYRVHENLLSGLLYDPALTKVGFNLLKGGVEGIRLIVNDVEHFATPEEEDEKDDDLEDSLANDVSPHDGVDNHVSLSGGLADKNCIAGGLSSEGKSSESVHDQVDPEHLSRGERRLAEKASTGKDNEHSNDVDGQLELKELAHVVIDVTSEFHGNEDRAEVVVQKLDIASALGDIGTSDSHGEADVRSVKGWGIVGAVAGDSNGTSNADQGIDKQELVIGLGPSHNLQFLLDSFEGVHVVNVADNLLSFLRFTSCGTGNFLCGFLSRDRAVNSSLEVLSFHADEFEVFLIVQVGLINDASFK